MAFTSVRLPGRTPPRRPTRPDSARLDILGGEVSPLLLEVMLALTLMDHYLRHRAQNADVRSETPAIGVERKA